MGYNRMGSGNRSDGGNNRSSNHNGMGSVKDMSIKNKRLLDHLKT